MVFEDAITRWRHSRSCRSGGFDNFIRRREIETQALQKMAETLDPEMALGSVPLPSGEAAAGCSKELCCFICRQRFMSLDEMREHVKYPCNKPANIQRPSMTVYIEEPTFGTGIQQHFTDGPGSRSSTRVHEETGTAVGTTNPVTVFMNDSDQTHAQGEAKPTNIYVNEKGETVIEVENLDLNTKSGELSLAHLLTQLSQQGIVFDHQGASESENSMAPAESHDIHGTLQELDLSQPTAVDAANTLTQLAGSAYRAASHQHADEMYTCTPPVKRIKSECIEVQYPQEQESHTVIHRDDIEVSEAHNYIICTAESEVISVVRADSGDHEASPVSSPAVHHVLQGGSLVSACVVDEASSDQTNTVEQYTVASHESEFQQSFSDTETTSETVETVRIVDPLRRVHQTVEYAASAKPNERVLSSLAGNLEATTVNRESSTPDAMELVHGPSYVIGQPERVFASSSQAENVSTAVHVTQSQIKSDAIGNLQLDGCTDSAVLPHTDSVSSTESEMTVSVTSVQQTQNAD